MLRRSPLTLRLFGVSVVLVFAACAADGGEGSGGSGGTAGDGGACGMAGIGGDVRADETSEHRVPNIGAWRVARPVDPRLSSHSTPESRRRPAYVNTTKVALISAVMLTGSNNPTLGRDMMFSILMIVLNGMVGLSLLLGGFRHVEQSFNLQSANTFLAVITPLAVLSLVLPNFTRSTPDPSFSIPQSEFLIVITLGLYAVFLAMQTIRHRRGWRPRCVWGPSGCRLGVGTRGDYRSPRCAFESAPALATIGLTVPAILLMAS